MFKKNIKDSFVQLNQFISNRAKSVANQFQTKNILNNQNRLFEETQLTSQQLGNIYFNCCWVNRAINLIAEEMFKNGLNINLKNKSKQEDFERFFKHNYIPVLKKAVIETFIYGGSVILKQDFTQNTKEEFKFNKSSELYNIPYDMYSVLPAYIPGTFIFNEVGSFIISSNQQKYTQAFIETEYKTLKTNSIEKSFFINFKGLNVPYQLMNRYKYQGGSLIAPNVDNIKADLIILEAIANSVFRNGSIVYKHKDFLNVLSGNEEKVTNYFKSLELLNSGANATSMLQIDVEEDLHALQISLSDYEPLGKMILTRLAGYFGLSLTKLLGKSPDGMNATGEADIFHDTQTITMWQEHFYNQTKEVLQFAYAKYFGVYEDVEFTFNSCQTVSKKDQLEIEAKIINNANNFDNALSSINGLEYLYKNEMVSGEDYNRLKAEAVDMESLDEDDTGNKNI